MFQDLQWFPDRMFLNGLTYRLEHARSDAWDGGEHFRFYKIKLLVDQYEEFFSLHPGLPARNIFELGTFDGGSTAFWYELLKPEVILSVDLERHDDSPYFKRWASEKRIGSVRTFWGVDQADKAQLRQLFAGNFFGPLDLVIDDASHLYGPSKASFEALFPLLRPGGCYIFEDWAWAHWDTVWQLFPPSERRPTDLVIEFIEAAGTRRSLISRVEVYQGFVAVFRGDAEVGEEFSLDSHIFRQPKPRSLIQKIRSRLRARASKAGSSDREHRS